MLTLVCLLICLSAYLGRTWKAVRGYKEGFSLAALPNDYRRYLATNNFSTKVFRRQIENLYANTGKPVVIVAHSYGTLLTLTNLVKPENKDLLPKIKKFIAIAPPFAGAGKLLDTFLHGMDDFNKSFDILGKKITITNYNKFGQLMMYKSLPVITVYTLRCNSDSLAFRQQAKPVG